MSAWPAPMYFMFVFQKVAEPTTKLFLRGIEKAEYCDMSLCVMTPEEVFHLWIQDTLSYDL